MSVIMRINFVSLRAFHTWVTGNTFIKNFTSTSENIHLQIKRGKLEAFLFYACYFKPNATETTAVISFSILLVSKAP
jgi:hypothetical protein